MLLSTSCPFSEESVAVACRAIFLTLIVSAATCGWVAAQESPPGETRALEPIVTGTEAGPERFFFGAEYLLWWVLHGPIPGPMVTSGPPSAAPGKLGFPGTEVLYGKDDDINYKGHSGGRFNLSFWFDAEQTLGWEAEGLFLETHTVHFHIDSDKAGTPVIARPFFNVLTGAEDAEVLTSPGSLFGGIDVFSDSRLWGAESNVLANALRGERGHVEFLAGFRYLGLDESLRISQSSTVLSVVPFGPSFLGVPVAPAFILSLTDRFETRNEFFGGQLGTRGVFEVGRWRLEGTAKLGLGDTKQWVNNMGVTELTGPAGSVGSVQAGLYAVGDNRGLYSRDRLTFIAETGFRLGYRITQRWAAHFGYTFLYWDDVARPGAQMSRVINPQLVPSNAAFGPATAGPEPLRRFASSDFWAMGLTLGLAFRY